MNLTVEKPAAIMQSRSKAEFPELPAAPMDEMELATANRPLVEAANAGIEETEAKMLSFPQADCPVLHRFGPGVYIRELHMRAGTLAIGHAQKHDHVNQMICGKVAMVDEGGAIRIVKGRDFSIGKPGRKVGYVIEYTVWQNIFPNPDDCRDVAELERRWLDKSETAQEFERQMGEIQRALRQPDREDFEAMLAEYGFDAETVRAQSESEADLIEMPHEYLLFTVVRPSAIEGEGLFLTWPCAAGEVIAPARIGGKRTPAGRYVNHSPFPNCEWAASDNGDVWLRALREISGCRGGDYGEELTVDYRQSMAISGVKPLGKGKQCQD